MIECGGRIEYRESRCLDGSRGNEVKGDLYGPSWMLVRFVRVRLIRNKMKPLYTLQTSRRHAKPRLAPNAGTTEPLSHFPKLQPRCDVADLADPGLAGEAVTGGDDGTKLFPAELAVFSCGCKRGSEPARNEESCDPSFRKMQRRVCRVTSTKYASSKTYL